MPRRERSSARGAPRTPTAPRSTRRPGGTHSSRPSAAAGGLDDVAAIAVGGQQHGMVCLDEDGAVVRPALLWNDTRSSGAATDLIAELGSNGDGAAAWAEAVGSVPVASFTVTKLRWLADHEPDHAARTAAVCLPHDYLTWRLAGASSLDALVTDRGDASGTGYWSPSGGSYRDDLFELALGRGAIKPRVLGPAEEAGRTAAGQVLGPGSGDNAAAALGLDARAGDVVVSIGTSGVACAVAERPVQDASGTVAGFADATGRFLPLVATLNAARVLDAAGADPGCRPRRAVPPRPVRTRRRGRAGPGALPRGRAHAQPPGRHRRRARPAAGHVDPGAPGPGGGRGDALRPGRRRGRGRGAGCGGRPADPDRRRSAVGGRTPDRVRGPRAARDRASARRVRRARRRPPGGLGAGRRRRAARMVDPGRRERRGDADAAGAGAVRRGPRPDRDRRH